MAAATNLVTCPQCGYLLPSDARTCPQCGVDLALLSLLAEKAYLEGVPSAAPMTTPPQMLVPRIGEYLIEQGILSQEQLNAALQRQKSLSEAGQHQLLGQTLIQMAFIDRETLDRAITRQIIELHAALQESNRTLERRVADRTSELRRALERLTEINQIKANLISNISHELRTPLAHIKGYVELISEEQLGPLNEEQTNAIQVVERATERLGGLIEDLIEFSTGTREGLTLHLETFPVNQLVENVLDRSQAKAEKAGVNLELSVSPDMPDIEADVERLSWVLLQLLDNAIKFTPTGGLVKLIGQTNNLGFEFVVEDTGIGIPQERMEEIFEPFHQLDGSPTRRYGGTGLGLALVQLILQAHGSEIAVESVEQEGSRFSFILPMNSG